MCEKQLSGKIYGALFCFWVNPPQSGIEAYGRCRIPVRCWEDPEAVQHALQFVRHLSMLSSSGREPVDPVVEFPQRSYRAVVLAALHSYRQRILFILFYFVS